MKITLNFDCMGCDAKETVKADVVKRFTSVSGRSYGIGSARVPQRRYFLVEPTGLVAWEWPPIEQLTPEGWQAFDPYT